MFIVQSSPGCGKIFILQEIGTKNFEDIPAFVPNEILAKMNFVPISFNGITSIQPSEKIEKIESVKAIFNASGASEATKTAIQEYTFKAFETLEKMDISPDKKVILKAFGDSLMGRNV